MLFTFLPKLYHTRAIGGVLDPRIMADMEPAMWEWLLPYAQEYEWQMLSLTGIDRFDESTYFKAVIVFHSPEVAALFTLFFVEVETMYEGEDEVPPGFMTEGHAAPG